MRTDRRQIKVEPLIRTDRCMLACAPAGRAPRTSRPDRFPAFPRHIPTALTSLSADSPTPPPAPGLCCCSPARSSASSAPKPPLPAGDGLVRREGGVARTVPRAVVDDRCVGGECLAASLWPERCWCRSGSSPQTEPTGQKPKGGGRAPAPRSPSVAVLHFVRLVTPQPGSADSRHVQPLDGRSDGPVLTRYVLRFSCSPNCPTMASPRAARPPRSGATTRSERPCTGEPGRRCGPRTLRGLIPGAGRRFGLRRG